MNQLEDFALSQDDVGREATRVLAIIHHEDARQALLRIAAANTRNSMARECLLELDAWKN